MDIVTTGAGPVRPLGKGEVHLRCVMPSGCIKVYVLEDVLFIPNFPINLFSGFTLDCAGGWTKQRLVYDNRDNVIFQLVRSSCYLYINLDEPCYIFNCANPGSSSVGFRTAFPAAIYEAPVTLETIHRRLGHLNFEDTKATVKISTGLDYQGTANDITLGVTKLCDPCEFGKPKKTIRRNSKQRSKC